MLSALFINYTAIEIRKAASLSKNSVYARDLVPEIRRNTAPDGEVGNYKLRRRHPRNAVYFYADRYIADPINEPDEFFKAFDENPGLTWLASVGVVERARRDTTGCRDSKVSRAVSSNVAIEGTTIRRYRRRPLQ